MSHPILPFMPAVFIPVSDLKRSTEWYADLLQRQIVPKEDNDGIYIFNLDGTQIILDSHAWGSPPMIMFDTKDIDGSHAFCEGHPHESLTDVFRDEFVSVFTINSNLICHAHRVPESPQPKPAHALLSKISHLIVHADNLQDQVRWYEAFVARITEPSNKFGELPSIRMERGADLLIDDNRLCQSSREFYKSLQMDIRTNPIAIVESPDLAAALNHVRSKGATATNGIESRFGNKFFMFYDPDGNGFMVCENDSL